MKKQISAVFLTLALLLSFVTNAYAEAKPVSLWVEGEQVQLEGSLPLVERGTTLVPAKPLLDKLKLTATWDNKKLTATKEGLSISLQIGSKQATVNGTGVELLAAPQLVDDIAYVPVRFISEAAGYEVDWDGKKQAITIKVKVASEGFLWKTQKGGNTVYLLGSIHVANSAMYPLRPAIQQAFDQSDYLVVEADITKSNDPEVQKLVVSMGSYTDGTTLKDHISADTYSKLNEILVENGVQSGALDNFKPWSVSSTIDYLKMLQSDYQGDLGIDLFFLNQALEKKLPIVELESITFQLKMLDNFSAALQEEMLLQSIAAYGQEESGVDQLSEMWVTGDEEQLLAIINDTAGNEELNKAMLTDRNNGMVDKINGYLNGTDNKTYFVVVGAAHMIGESGIVTQLEKQGLAVEKQ